MSKNSQDLLPPDRVCSSQCDDWSLTRDNRGPRDLAAVPHYGDPTWNRDSCNPVYLFPLGMFVSSHGLWTYGCLVEMVAGEKLGS